MPLEKYSRKKRTTDAAPEECDTQRKTSDVVKWHCIRVTVFLGSKEDVHICPTRECRSPGGGRTRHSGFSLWFGGCLMFFIQHGWIVAVFFICTCLSLPSIVQKSKSSVSKCQCFITLSFCRFHCDKFWCQLWRGCNLLVCPKQSKYTWCIL